MNWNELFQDKIVKPNDIDMVLYHGGCTDGFMSATIAKKWMDSNKKTCIEYIPCYHNQKFDARMLIGKHVLICDFAFPVPVWQDILTATKGNVLILDHHETSQKNLDTNYEPNVYINQDFSGASLTWYYFYPDKSAPNGVLFVEDHDLWKHALPMSRAFSSMVYYQKFNFDFYTQLLDDEFIVNNVIPEGKILWKQIQRIVEQIASQATPMFIKSKSQYFFVASVPCNTLQSEVGDYLVQEKFPAVDFTMMYHYVYNTYEYDYAGQDFMKYSLRSPKHGINVEEIAQPYGGGHRQASAGSCVDLLTHPPGTKLLNSYQLYFSLQESLHRVSFENKKLLVVNSFILARELVSYLMQIRTEVVQMKKTGDTDEVKNEKDADNEVKEHQETTEENKEEWRLRRKLEKKLRQQKRKQKIRLCPTNSVNQQGLYWIRLRQKDPFLQETYDGAIAWFFDGRFYHVTMSTTKLNVTNLQLYCSQAKKGSISYKAVTSDLYEMISTISIYELFAIFVQQQIFF